MLFAIFLVKFVRQRQDSKRFRAVDRSPSHNCQPYERNLYPRTFLSYRTSQAKDIQWIEVLVKLLRRYFTSFSERVLHVLKCFGLNMTTGLAL